LAAANILPAAPVGRLQQRAGRVAQGRGLGPPAAAARPLLDAEPQTRRNLMHRFAPLLAPLCLSLACSVTGDGAGPGTEIDWPLEDAISYRSVESHPGCSASGMSYAPASLPHYLCAAKSYPFPAGVSEDTSRPIVLLVHGNSDTPTSFERFPADTGDPMLAELLPEHGFRTLAIDLRIDLVDDPQGNNDSENAARNIDHGWAVPLLQHFIASMLEAHPDRRITIIGFSLGVTVIRDALRRIHLEGEVDAWSRIEDLIYLAGANHGVSTCGLCGQNPTMRGEVTCEMGCRDNFRVTEFMKPLNGPDGAFETPCSDGDSAYGEVGVCGGNAIAYTTIAMRDIADGSYQDEFVSEASSRLLGADNRLIGLADVDETGYFFDGLFKNHYGPLRAKAALDIVLEKVLD
jgi:pimeloyl-ACP methyl ester carboxylesterase